MPMISRAPLLRLFACAAAIGACATCAPTQAETAAPTYANARSAPGVRDWCSVSPAESGDPAAVKLIARATQHLAQTPHPLPRLHTEGTLPHQGIYDESVSAARDFPLMRDAALAWRLTGDKRFVEQVDAFLHAWVGTYMPSFNPIDETKFDALIQAYTLARDGLTPSTRDETQRFLRTLAEGYIARTNAAKQPLSHTWINNWQSHRIKLMTMSVAALGDRTLMAQSRRLFLQQLANNVRPDGSVEDFEDRDALHYVVYDLEPLTLAAIAVQPYGQHWLRERASNGATLAAAIDWLVPYADGSRTHEEYVHSHVPFDKTRADAGLPGFAGPWSPKNAATLFWQAARLDPQYRPLAERLVATAPDWLALCAAR
ncbi:alginate lyase family protein [Ralstonia sp. R-29]|uniref:alginate lyase family protein n=1 Tax=Ralstonia sp. R-29 TaxID=3404059 RepID=UPI003CEF7BD0